MRTIEFRGKSYRLTVSEMKSLKKQLEEPSRFVALNQSGHIIAEGDTLKIGDRTDTEAGTQMSFHEDPENMWYFYGDDEYTIVTRKQFEALVDAGLAFHKE